MLKQQAAVERCLDKNLELLISRSRSLQTAGVPRAWATHGGEDVPVFAIGPLSSILFSGSIDQSYIPHAISYAACLQSEHADRCTNIQTKRAIHPSPSNSSLSARGRSADCGPSVEPNSAAISSGVVVTDREKNTAIAAGPTVPTRSLVAFSTAANRSNLLTRYVTGLWLLFRFGLLLISI